MAKKPRKSAPRKPRKKPDAPKAPGTALMVIPQPQPQQEEPKRGRGRPTDYRPEMCDTVIECGHMGYSRAQIARALDVAVSTLADWEAVHPEFAAAMTRAHDLALAWWEDAGQRGITMGSFFNAAAFGLQLRNRFPKHYRNVTAEEAKQPAAPAQAEADAASDVSIDFSRLTIAQLEALASVRILRR